MSELRRASGGDVPPRFAESAMSALDNRWQLHTLSAELTGLVADGLVPAPLPDEPRGRHALPPLDPTPIYHALARGGCRSRQVEPAPCATQQPVTEPIMSPRFWDGSATPVGSSAALSDPAGRHRRHGTGDEHEAYGGQLPRPGRTGGGERPPAKPPPR